MSANAWRATLLALCLVVGAVDVTEIVGTAGLGGAQPWVGIWGMTPGPSSRPYTLEVSSIDAGGPSDRAGLRRGDLIDIRDLTALERFSLLSQPLAGKPLTLTIQRDARQIRAAIVPSPTGIATWWYIEAAQAGILWMLIFAGVIAWRRAHVQELRLLCLVLITYAISYVASPGSGAAPWTWVYVVKSVTGALSVLVIAMWAKYALSFAKPASNLRRIATWACYTFVAISVTTLLAITFGVYSVRLDPVPLIWASLTAYNIACALALVCSGLALIASAGIENQRALWSLIPLSALICIDQIYNLTATFSGTYAAVYYWAFISCIATLVMPVLLTYAALSKRLIDIGFVLNRAVVFAIVSTIVVGAFVLAEWAASEWFAASGRNTSAVVVMVVALALGLSLRYIHRYVDRFVDQVFFRRRYDDEAALRRFAHEAAYITDRSELLERTVRTVKEHTGGAAASLLLLVSGRAYAPAASTDGDATLVDEDDPAIVSMRAWHRPVDLQSIAGSALQGQFAFPMVSRGKLLGVLVCGAKNDSEAFAPDESNALATLAHGVGAALGAASVAGDDATDALLRTQERILDELRDLPNKIRTQSLRPRFDAGAGDK